MAMHLLLGFANSTLTGFLCLLAFHFARSFAPPRREYAMASSARKLSALTVWCRVAVLQADMVMKMAYVFPPLHGRYPLSSTVCAWYTQCMIHSRDNSVCALAHLIVVFWWLCHHHRQVSSGETTQWLTEEWLLLCCNI